MYRPFRFAYVLSSETLSGRPRRVRMPSESCPERHFYFYFVAASQSPPDRTRDAPPRCECEPAHSHLGLQRRCLLEYTLACPATQTPTSLGAIRTSDRRSSDRVVRTSPSRLSCAVCRNAPHVGGEPLRTCKGAPCRISEPHGPDARTRQHAT
jgi:hypothetical protein